MSAEVCTISRNTSQVSVSDGFCLIQGVEDIETPINLPVSADEWTVISSDEELEELRIRQLLRSWAEPGDQEKAKCLSANELLIMAKSCCLSENNIPLSCFFLFEINYENLTGIADQTPKDRESALCGIIKFQIKHGRFKHLQLVVRCLQKKKRVEVLESAVTWGLQSGKIKEVQLLLRELEPELSEKVFDAVFKPELFLNNPSFPIDQFEDKPVLLAKKVLLIDESSQLKAHLQAGYPIFNYQAGLQKRLDYVLAVAASLSPIFSLTQADLRQIATQKLKDCLVVLKQFGCEEEVNKLSKKYVK